MLLSFLRSCCSLALLFSHPSRSKGCYQQIRSDNDKPNVRRKWREFPFQLQFCSLYALESSTNIFSYFFFPSSFVFFLLYAAAPWQSSSSSSSLSSSVGCVVVMCASFIIPFTLIPWKCSMLFRSRKKRKAHAYKRRMKMCERENDKENPHPIPPPQPPL